MQGACVCATTSGCRCHTEPKKSCTLIARPNQCCSSPSPLLSRTLPGTCVCTPPSVASVCPRGTKVIACLCSSPSQPHSHISRVGLAAAAKSHLVCTARVIQLQRPEAGAIVLVPVKSEAAWNATSPLVVLLCGNAVRTNADYCVTAGPHLCFHEPSPGTNSHRAAMPAGKATFTTVPYARVTVKPLSERNLCVAGRRCSFCLL